MAAHRTVSLFFFIIYYGCCYDFSPFTNVSIPNILKEIRELDKSLMEMFATLPKDGGNMMLNYMKRYIQGMKEIVHYAYENKTKTREEANELIEQVGPDFIEYPFDREKIRENFDWESEQYDEMYEMRMKTVKVWNDFHDNF